MAETIFDKIVQGEIEAFVVWQDDNYLAFLTPFPSMPGLTVVIPKQNLGDDVFNLSSEAYQGLLAAAKTVAAKLKAGLGVARIAMVFEGTGVAYVHAKLYPLHGKLAGETHAWTSHQEFHPQYLGYLTTAEGPKMADQELRIIQAKIQAPKEA